jgi:hypothetical protein
MSGIKYIVDCKPFRWTTRRNELHFLDECAIIPKSASGKSLSTFIGADPAAHVHTVACEIQVREVTHHNQSNIADTWIEKIVETPTIVWRGT